MSTHIQGGRVPVRAGRRKGAAWGKSARMTAHNFLSSEEDKAKVREASTLMGCSQGDVLRRGIDLAWRAARREAPQGGKPEALGAPESDPDDGGPVGQALRGKGAGGPCKAAEEQAE